MEEIINAPAGGRLLQCLHEATSIPDGMWHTYVDPGRTEIYPLVQRRGERFWVTLEGGNLKELSAQDILSLCVCGANSGD